MTTPTGTRYAVMLEERPELTAGLTAVSRFTDIHLLRNSRAARSGRDGAW
jgi:hypothetical protein